MARAAKGARAAPEEAGALTLGPAAPPEAHVFTVPAGVPFLDALARRLLTETERDPLALGRYTILLPTRRACRALQETFLRLTEGRPLLLPRLTPLGDIDEEELLLAGGDEEPGGGGLDLAPALPPLTRQLMLSRLVAQAARARGEAMSAERAAALAGELAKLADQVATERLSFDRLSEIVPGHLAAHWQTTIEFLEIVTKAWPKVERQAGAMGAAERRNALLARQAELWSKAPPKDPVIAAGSTGSIPATADLIQVVAGLPKGRVVLPGLDPEGDELFWRKVREDPSHPQHGLALLLTRLGLKPQDVALWPGAAPPPAVTTRMSFLAEALRPAALTHRWSAEASDAKRERLRASLGPPARAGGGADEPDIGFARIDCPGPAEEALTIALLLREAVETPGRRAALVTPDRRLARRVAAELKRWAIEIDDSAGISLGETPPGVFLRLAAALPLDDVAPVPLLSLLKHPLTAGGEAPGHFRAQVRALERAVLRGPRPAPGFAGLRAALAAVAKDDAALRPLLPWLDRLARTATPYLDLVSGSEAALGDLVRAHVGFAEALAATDAERGAARLWQGEAGEAAAQFVDELLEAARGHAPLPGAEYPALLNALMATRRVRPRYGRHPRLFIWGLLEARLQQADLMILGGLNEGTWPAEPAPDPWMSRPMREAFGLPPAERRIGLAAHDFQQACGAPRIVLTRARKVDGTPTVPSRWLTRIDALREAWGMKPAELIDPTWLDWAQRLDRPSRPPAPIQRPAPTPPVAARPLRLSVTQVETWMRDPYAIYARHILRLKPLEPLDADPGAAERGTLVHAALDAFVKRYPASLPANAREALLECGREAFGAMLDRPAVWAFWWPRFERIADWFLAQRAETLDRIAQSHAELRGRLAIPTPLGQDFLLTAKADRIDRLKAGGLAIVDYKTGTVPRGKAVELGFAPQLPLEAAIAAAGGFGDLGEARVIELAYWRLSGGEPAGEIRPVGRGTDPAALADAASDGLRALVARFENPATPYLAQPRAAYAPDYTDYAHLARVAEWSAGGDEE
jgi:ATP-dependent helicase/nuclease subunit B